jgi:hypothetical protein
MITPAFVRNTVELPPSAFEIVDVVLDLDDHDRDRRLLSLIGLRENRDPAQRGENGGRKRASHQYPLRHPGHLQHR